MIGSSRIRTSYPVSGQVRSVENGGWAGSQPHEPLDLHKPQGPSVPHLVSFCYRKRSLDNSSNDISSIRPSNIIPFTSSAIVHPVFPVFRPWSVSIRYNGVVELQSSPSVPEIPFATNQFHVRRSLGQRKAPGFSGAHWPIPPFADQP